MRNEVEKLEPKIVLASSITWGLISTDVEMFGERYSTPQIVFLNHLFQQVARLMLPKKGLDQSLMTGDATKAMIVVKLVAGWWWEEAIWCRGRGWSG